MFAAYARVEHWWCAPAATHSNRAGRRDGAHAAHPPHSACAGGAGCNVVRCTLPRPYGGARGAAVALRASEGRRVCVQDGGQRRGEAGADAWCLSAPSSASHSRGLNALRLCFADTFWLSCCCCFLPLRSDRTTAARSASQRPATSFQTTSTDQERRRHVALATLLNRLLDCLSG